LPPATPAPSPAPPGPTPPAPYACADCLRRTWLLAELAGPLEVAMRQRERFPLVLALPDEDLLAALGRERRPVLAAAYERFDADRARRAAADAGLAVMCRHDLRYPPLLRQAPDAPAVLHVAGRVEVLAELARGPSVAVVGARRPSGYGVEVARALGRGLAAARVPVVSGMALGIDSAAHTGALEAGGATVAVLAGAAERAYPPSKSWLHRRLCQEGAVVSEMPPGFVVRRWCFPARNRIIAALAALTIVVEGGERSGSLITAGLARDLGRGVAAVPGRVTSPLAAGPNALLFDGADLVRDAQDVLDLLFGVGGRIAGPARDPSRLPPERRALLDAVAAGADTDAQLAADGHDPVAVLEGLAELELLGFLRRDAGGRYEVRA
jgi:DNA processing protein